MTGDAGTPDRADSERAGPFHPRALLAVAREALRQHLAGTGGSAPAGIESAGQPHTGVFVTLRRGDELRGCMGSLDGCTPLETAVRHLVVSAATDPRFSPVEPAELEEIRIEISILGPRRRVREASEIRVGADGIQIALGPRRGLLLPQVAAERRWSPLRFLEETCVKAGLPRDSWRRPEAVVEAFEAEVFGEDSAG